MVPIYERMVKILQALSIEKQISEVIVQKHDHQSINKVLIHMLLKVA